MSSQRVSVVTDRTVTASGPDAHRESGTGERVAEKACDALGLWTELARSYQTVSRTVSERVAEYGVTVPQFEILELLHQRGPLSLGELADELFVTGGNITYVMDRLEDRELVSRRRSPQDRRVVKALLTPSGRKLIATVLPGHAEFVRARVGHLEARERRELQRLLEKLREGAQGDVDEA